MRIIFTVTNDLNYDQRMIRICSSLARNGYQVKLIGRKFNNATGLNDKPYQQKRIRVFFKKGFGFYLEYNVKLFFCLLFQRTDVFGCIDLDTMLPVYAAAFLRRKIKVYDAHEYFSQLKEVVKRPRIYGVWHFIERTFVPKFKNGYTVSEGIAEELFKNYQVRYEVIRNVPLLRPLSAKSKELGDKIILYQGSVNEGRGFEYLIPAMKNVDARLHIYGDGNFMEQAVRIAEENHLQSKVLFKGKLLPDDLDKITQQADIGINLVEPFGKSQLLSLANKFFDYMQNELPQVTMDFSEYRRINDEHEVAILLSDLSIGSIADALNTLLNNDQVYQRLMQNCKEARKKYNWQMEEKRLLDFYDGIKMKAATQ